MKILIVEDEKYRMDLFMQFLLPHDLYFATTADRAINLIDKTKFDIIFLDFNLEKGNSWPIAIHLIDKNIKSKVFIHSMNAPGTDKLLQLFGWAKMPATAAIFSGREFYNIIKDIKNGRYK